MTFTLSILSVFHVFVQENLLSPGLETNKDQIIIKIKPFINKYKWEGINFPSEKDHWKTFEKK